MHPSTNPQRAVDRNECKCINCMVLGDSLHLMLVWVRQTAEHKDTVHTSSSTAAEPVKMQFHLNDVFLFIAQLFTILM